MRPYSLFHLRRRPRGRPEVTWLMAQAPSGVRFRIEDTLFIERFVRELPICIPGPSVWDVQLAFTPGARPPLVARAFFSLDDLLLYRYTRDGARWDEVRTDGAWAGRWAEAELVGKRDDPTLQLAGGGAPLTNDTGSHGGDVTCTYEAVGEALPAALPVQVRLSSDGRTATAWAWRLGPLLVQERWR